MFKTKPVGPRVLNNFNFLKRLAKTKSRKKQQKFIKEANAEELLSIVEICTNILNSNFNLNKRQKSKLIPYANYIRKLARTRSEKTARNLVQTGDGPLAIAAVLIPVLA